MINVVANKYQYEVPAFINAFKKKFGVTPGQYRINPKQITLFETLDMNKWINAG